MGDDAKRCCPRRLAELRFSIVGSLLSAPPKAGELTSRLEELCRKQWKHPQTGDIEIYGFSTIERWYYKARKADDPLAALTAKVRKDRGSHRAMSKTLLEELKRLYTLHPGWSVKLHLDNLAVLCEREPEKLGKCPSLSTVRRRMQERGMTRRKKRKNPTEGQKKAEERLEKREVRSFEATHVHLLWHYDFHELSRKVLLPDGCWHKPVLFAVLDDRSRLCCHIQWYLTENTANLVHGLHQAYLKRGLPRMEMHDNGKAMRGAEIVAGSQSLGIEHEPTLAYSPYQNGKQEHFWETVEGRLMAMLEHVKTLELSFLNRATQAWCEIEYNRTFHREIGMTPLEKVLEGPGESRKSPDLSVLSQRFTRRRHSTQRKSDGTISIEGVRFEIPNYLRMCRKLYVGYQKWNKSVVYVFDERTEEVIARLYPLDKEKNFLRGRRSLEPLDKDEIEEKKAVEEEEQLPPLMEKILAEYAATGLPPAYLPKEELRRKPQEELKEEL